MDLSIVVLAAGQGARMRSDLPPVLHPVAGWPMVRHVLAAAQSLHPACLSVVVGHKGEIVQKYVGDGAGAVAQEAQLGTAHATLQAMAQVAGRAGTVLVLHGELPLIRPETLLALVEHHQASGGVMTLLSAWPEDPTGYARVEREPASGRVQRVLGEGEGSTKPSGPAEVAGGAFCFRDAWLWPALRKLGGLTLTGQPLADLAALARREGYVLADLPSDAPEVLAVHTRAALARAEAEMRKRINHGWMQAGVTLIDPAATYIEAGVKIGSDTTLWPGTILQGSTKIGQRCAIGPGAVVRDSSVGDDCRVELSVLEGAVMESGSNIGPFSHLRKGARLGAGAHVGNFGELKNSFLGPGAKMGHFSYLGDATIGENANIGAGTITCNFDGERKNPTVVGKDAFIGSDTMLVAPVKVGEGAKTGAGSVVTRDIPAHAVAYGVPARVRRRAGEEDMEDK